MNRSSGAGLGYKSGAMYLGDVATEREGVEDLAKFLSTLRHHLRPLDAHYSTNPFHLLPLDNLISHLHSQSPSPSPLPILELTSPPHPSGKTHLLYHLAALSILPFTHTFPTIPTPIPLHGKSSSTILLDCTHTFNPHRLSTILRNHITTHINLHLCLLTKPTTPQPPLSPEITREITSLILASTAHIHIFYPTSTHSLLTTLSALKSHLIDNHWHPPLPPSISPIRPISLLLLNNPGIFHHLNKLHQLTSTSTISSPNPTILHLLRSLQSHLHCSIIFTTTTLQNKETPPQGDNTNPDIPAHHHHHVFPPPLPASFPTLCLLLQKCPVPSFPSDLSLSGAYRDRYKRQELVDRGWVSVVVDRIGKGYGGMEAMEAVKRTGLGGFRFRIGSEGVIFDEVGERVVNSGMGVEGGKDTQGLMAEPRLPIGWC